MIYDSLQNGTKTEIKNMENKVLIAMLTKMLFICLGYCTCGKGLFVYQKENLKMLVEYDCKIDYFLSFL